MYLIVFKLICLIIFKLSILLSGTVYNLEVSKKIIVKYLNCFIIKLIYH